MSFPLDPEKTAPLWVGPTSARTGVLLLHGFTGSPWELEPLATSLAQRGFFVHAPRLPGHGTVPEAMLWSTWQDWLDAATEALHALHDFDRVCVGGLSMGALLSLLLAEQHRARVSKLVLMAPVMRLKVTGARLLERLGPGALTRLVGPWLEKKSTDLEDDDARALAPLMPRYPSSRLYDLFELQRLARHAAPQVTTPTLIAAATHDHVIDFDAAEALHRSIPQSRLLVLQRGFHILPRDRDRAVLLSEVAEFVDDDPQRPFGHGGG